MKINGLGLISCVLSMILFVSACEFSKPYRCEPGTALCQCSNDGTCGDGLTCELGICIESGSEPDAGIDSEADTETTVETDSDSGEDSTADECAYTCSAHCYSIGGDVKEGTCETEGYKCCDLGTTEVDTEPIESDIVSELPLRVPITREIYTADPSAHVFDETLYVYPSHDQDSAMAEFNMVDYHVFSWDEESSFVDHGEALHVDDVPWASRYMWAPDIAEKDGVYYFYFPAKNQSGIFQIGVATGSSPTGPFSPESEPIAGSFSIDPAIFIDDDSEAYMYFGGLWGGELECWRDGTYNSACSAPGSWEPALGPRVARLDSGMKAFDGDIEEISILGSDASPLLSVDESKRFFEGVWMHKYEGTYYLSYSTGTTHLIVYATGDSPTGPFTYRGVLLPNHNSGWTTHHSIVAYKGNWYLFYHDASCSGVDKRRCVKVADLYYNDDGTIRTVAL